MSGLDQGIQQNLLRVFCRYPVIQRVLLFGSRARGDHKYYSDIDLAIEASAKLPAQIFWEIEEAAGILKVDIIELNQLHNQKLKEKIAKEGIEIYPGP